MRDDKLSVGGSMDPEVFTATSVVAAVDPGPCGNDECALSALAASEVTGRVLSVLAGRVGVVAPDWEDSTAEVSPETMRPRPTRSVAQERPFTTVSPNTRRPRDATAETMRVAPGNLPETLRYCAPAPHRSTTTAPMLTSRTARAVDFAAGLVRAVFGVSDCGSGTMVSSVGMVTTAEAAAACDARVCRSRRTASRPGRSKYASASSISRIDA